MFCFLRTGSLRCVRCALDVRSLKWICSILTCVLNPPTCHDSIRFELIFMCSHSSLFILTSLFILASYLNLSSLSKLISVQPHISLFSNLSFSEPSFPHALVTWRVRLCAIQLPNLPNGHQFKWPIIDLWLIADVMSMLHLETPHISLTVSPEFICTWIIEIAKPTIH